MLEIFGAVFIIIFGTLGHFIFEWSGHRKWAGIFFAVNESTWEHMKLTIYPSAVWFAVEVAVRGFSAPLVVAQAASAAAMLALVPGLFYGYTFFTKQNWLIVDIICFVLSVCGGMLAFAKVSALPYAGPAATTISVIFLAGVAAAYFLWSYNPPHCFLFRDPVSKGFGPGGHGCHSDFHHAHRHGA